MKSKAVDTGINAISVNACNSALTVLKQNEEAKERFNKVKANQQKDYEKLIEVLSYLNERLDVDEFKSKVITDLKLKSIISELKIKLCNLDNI